MVIEKGEPLTLDEELTLQSPRFTLGVFYSLIFPIDG
jgi:hypothetical protein